jgi:hypothetical protein
LGRPHYQREPVAGVGRIEEDNIVRNSIRRIGAAEPADVQMIAAAQLELLAGYHQMALAQSRRIFFLGIGGWLISTGAIEGEQPVVD